MAIVIVVSVVMQVALERYLLDPLLSWLFEHGIQWLSATGLVVRWILRLVLAAVLLMVALNVSLALMGMWYENLVERVVASFQERAAREFTWRHFVANQMGSLWVAVQDVALSVLLLPMGFIPIVGPVLVFVGASLLTGRSVIAAYETVLLEPGQSLSNRMSGQKITAFGLGWVIGLVAFIPFLGWFLAPWLLVRLVIGWAYWRQELRTVRVPEHSSQKP